MRHNFSAILAIVLLSIIALSDISHARPPHEEIVGGAEETGFSGAGWLYVHYNGGTTFVCSGALIGPDVILTAAHCIGVLGEYGPPVHICYGNDPYIPDADLIDWHSTTPCDDVASIAANTWIAHENYPGSGAEFDVALVRLAEFPNAQPIPVVDAPLQAANSGLAGLVVGYGVAHVLTGDAGVKRSAPIVVDTITSTTISWNFTRDENHQVTSGSACHGDSGGPAMALDDAGNAVIIGTISGPGDSLKSSICRDVSLATNIGYFNSWLSQQAAAWGTEIFFDELPN